MLNAQLKDIVGPETFSIATDLVPKFGLQHIHQLIKCRYEGQLDTGRMMHALLAFAREVGIEIVNGMAVDAVSETGNGVAVQLANMLEIPCSGVVIATNGFAQQLLPDLDVAPARAQVLITKPVANLPIRGTFHYEKGYYYFRDVGQRLLFGGGRNLDPTSETTTTLKTSTNVQEALDTILREVILPNHPFEVEHRWAGVMGMGNFKLPIVKKTSKNVVCAVRLGGMGVALGSLVGQEAAELITT